MGYMNTVKGVSSRLLKEERKFRVFFNFTMPVKAKAYSGLIHEVLLEAQLHSLHCKVVGFL